MIRASGVTSVNMLFFMVLVIWGGLTCHCKTGRGAWRIFRLSSRAHVTVARLFQCNYKLVENANDAYVYGRSMLTLACGLAVFR